MLTQFVKPLHEPKHLSTGNLLRFVSALHAKKLHDVKLEVIVIHATVSVCVSMRALTIAMSVNEMSSCVSTMVYQWMSTAHSHMHRMMYAQSASDLKHIDLGAASVLKM